LAASVDAVLVVELVPHSVEFVPAPSTHPAVGPA
jgi:hypothetical protein